MGTMGQKVRDKRDLKKIFQKTTENSKNFKNSQKFSKIIIN